MHEFIDESTIPWEYEITHDFYCRYVAEMNLDGSIDCYPEWITVDHIRKIDDGES